MKQLKRPIITTLVIALLCITAFIGYAYEVNRKTVEASEWVHKTSVSLDHINNILISATRRESATRGYFISGDASLLRSMNPDSLRMDADLRSLDTLLQQEPDQLNNLLLLRSVLTRKAAVQQSLIAGRPGWQLLQQVPEGMIAGQHMMDSVYQLVDSMLDWQHSALESHLAMRHLYTSRSYQFGITGGILLGIILFMALLRINFILHQLRTTRVQLNDREALYKQLVEESGVLIYVATLDGFFEYISPQVLEITGYTPEELLERHYSLLLTPELFEELKVFYEEQIGRDAQLTTREIEIVTKSGARKWVEQQVTLRHHHEKVIGYQALVKDIHEKKLLQLQMETLHMEQEKMQQLFISVLNHTPSFVFIKDLKGKYLLVNKEFEKITGHTANTILGRTDKEVSQPTEARRWASSDQKVIAGKEPVRLIGSLDRNGKICHYMVTKYPLLDKNNEIYGVGATGTDITDHIRREKELTEARVAAEEGRHVQEIFLANMSHELRTPINGITGMTYLLDKTELTEEQREYIDAIEVSTGKLTLLINDVLEISRMRTGQLQLEPSDLNLPLLLQKTMVSVSPPADAKGVNLYCDLDENIPTHLSGDTLRLAQVFGNLLENAVKFTASGNIQLTAMLLKETDTQVRIGVEVKDTGIGIASDQLENIFETYAQSSPDTAQYFGGAGLGLSICRELVHLHGGTISVKSTLGEGSAFYVELPLDKYLPSNTRPTPRLAITSNSLEGKKILLAEDNPINQKVVRYTLQHTGAQVDVVADGLTALQMLMQKTYDCILMDLQMPEMNGYEAIAALRRLGFQTPAIATTAAAQKEEAEKCLSAGFNGYLAKPFFPDELVYKILDLLKAMPVAAPTPTQTSGGLVDFEYIYSITQKDKAYLIELLDTFSSSAPSVFDHLEQALEERNWEEIKLLAHRMRASLSIVRIVPLNTLMEQLEADAALEIFPVAQQRLQAAKLLYEEAAIVIAEERRKL